MTTYMVFMMITAFRGCRLLNRVLTLQYENFALIENLSLSNKKIFNSYKKLEQREHAMILINKMNDMLQTCQTSNEAYGIILFTAKKLSILAAV